MIRVIHLLPTFLQGDGPSNVVLNLVKAQQVEVEWAGVWSLRTPPHSRDLSNCLAEGGVDVASLKMRESFLDPGVLWRLVQKLRVSRPEVLHCHLVRANLYGRIAAGIANVHVVVNTLHNTEAYYTSSAIRDRLVSRVEVMTQEMVSAFVAVSASAKSSYLQAGGRGSEKITVIHNGVDLPNAHPALTKDEYRDMLGLPSKGTLIVSIGRLHRQKNYSMLVRCAEIIRAHNPGVVWAIAGDGPERSALCDQIKRLGLEKTVRILGHIRDVSILLSSADVFVLTSRYEGLPVALLEAMAHGIPCLSTDVGGIPSVNVGREACSLVQVDDDNEFVRKLLLLIEDRDRLVLQGHLAREVIQECFSSEVMAHKYVELYRSLLA